MIKLAVLFGSSSNEHEISIVSATSIINNLNKDKYDITPIYLDKENNFYLWNINIYKIPILKVGDYPINLTLLENPFDYLKQFDCIFNMVHGKNGEDGVLSSIFDFLNIKYVGNKPLASMLTMDKILTKSELEANQIKTTPYFIITSYNDEFLFQNKTYNFESLLKILKHELQLPIFVKPAKSGSSIGITKVSSFNDLECSLINALKIDNRILIEKEIKGRELECAILEKDGKIISSKLGEVITNSDFYSFDAKYKCSDSKTLIPADISKEMMNKIQNIAKRAFQIFDLHYYSRIDFFLTDENEVFLNEINTIPGFTEISMYPKLLENIGYSYSEILDILIINALK